jgi:hypothetical protein
VAGILAYRGDASTVRWPPGTTNTFEVGGTGGCNHGGASAILWVTVGPGDVVLFSNDNGGAVQNEPSRPTMFTLAGSAFVTRLRQR